MKTRRALTALAAGLLATSVATAVYSPAASAAGTVSCSWSGLNKTDNWFDCTSSNGTQTIWYINGVRQSEGVGAASYSWFCTYGHFYTIGVNLNTTLAATWRGYCDDRS